MTSQPNSPRAYKPKRHIVVDIETLSTRRNAAVVDLAAVVVDFNRPTSDTFQVFIRQGEQVAAGEVFELDHDTLDWHGRHDPEFLPHCENNGVSFQEAMCNFNSWIFAQSEGVELHFWSQGKDFDFPILENMFRQAGLATPWAYSRLHCLRDLVWLNPSTRIKAAGPVAHKALPDAMHEAKQLVATVKNSTWYQRLFR